MGEVIDISDLLNKKDSEESKVYFFKTYSSSRARKYDLARVQITFKERKFYRSLWSGKYENRILNLLTIRCQKGKVKIDLLPNPKGWGFPNQ